MYKCNIYYNDFAIDTWLVSENCESCTEWC